MKESITTRAAAIFCAVLMIMPDVARSITASDVFDKQINRYSQEQDEAELFKVVANASNTSCTDKAFMPVPVLQKHENEIAIHTQNDTLAHSSVTMVGKSVSTAYGIIGRSELDPTGNPHDDVFDVEISAEAISGKPNAYLRYKLRGLANGAGIAKSINSNPTFGTLDFTSASIWVEATEPIQLEQLVIGTNYVRFSMPHMLDIPVEIKEVSIVFYAQPLEANQSKLLPITPCTSNHAFALWPVQSAEASYALTDLEVPSIPSNIINVTRGAYAYGIVGDNGYKRIGIGIDKERIPAGMEAKEVQTYYFDYSAKRWTAIGTDSIYVRSQDPFAEATSEGEGSPGEGDVNFVPSQGATQYFNGLIKTPEMPEASAFTPTTIQGIKAANPAEGMNIMQPPGIDKSGDANISYPLAITPGRNGMTPQLALNYNSSQGSGLVGVGWNIATPKVVVDTRWGVPEFSGSTETEVYSMNGSSLRMEGKVRANRPDLSSGEPAYVNRPSKNNVRFFEKTMDGYKEIVRHGTSPQNYFWIETTADQSKYYYGTLNSTSQSAAHVLKDPSGNVAEWLLAKIVDKWGNEIEYEYAVMTGTATNPMLSGGTAMLPSAVYYTGHQSIKGKYSIHFEYTQNRQDATTNLRYGFKVNDEARLHKVVAKYEETLGNRVEYRNFTFNYIIGAFGKTLLQNIVENRHGQEFYRHAFGYKEMPDETFETQILIIDKHSIEDPQDGNDHKEFKIDEFKKSPLSSSKSFGFSSGVYVGFGTSVTPNKEGTYGPAYTFSQNWMRGKNQMIDVNGDGLLDFLTKQNGQLKFLPITKSTLSELEISNTLVGITGAQDFLRANSTSNELAFEGYPVSGAFFGLAYSNSFSRTTSFLVDYNADGLPDIAQDGNILFAHLQSDGSIAYIDNSGNTPNPVYKGADAIANTETDNDAMLEVEMVRTWKAPFSGQIEIMGNPSLAPGSADGVEVAVQKNATFIADFTPIAANSALSLNIPLQNVSEGDLIMFRVKSVENGFGDVLTWNPSISYIGTPAFDANGINLSNTTAANAFIVSGIAPVTIDASASVLFDWAVAPVIPPQTDEVTFKIVINGLDANENQVGAPIQYIYKLAPNTGITLSSSLFRNSATSVVMPNTQTFYSINQATKLQIHFEVVANSQVNWKEMPWQPIISYYTLPASTSATNAYPVVNYSIKKLQRYKGAYQLPQAFPKPFLQVYPVAATALFSNLTVAKHAKLIVKTNQSYLSTLEVTFMPNGTVYYYNPGNTTPIPLGSYNVNQAIAKNTLVNSELFFEFVTDDEQLANLFKVHGSIKVYRVNTNGSTSSLSQYATTTTYNTWLNQQGGITGPDYLGHGMFAWMQSAKAPINPADIKMPSGTGLNTTNLNVNNIETELISAGISISTMKAMPLVPQRLEEASVQPGVLPALKLPRYTFGGANLQVHANGCAPGKFGEAIEPDPITSYIPVIPSLTRAEAPEKKVSISNEVSKTLGVGPLSNSETLPIGLGSTAKNDFFDFNGDNYPDLIRRGTNNLSLQKTNSYGGLVSQSSNVGADDVLGKSASNSIGIVASGTHTFKKTFLKGKTLGIVGSYSNDAADEMAAWIDVNGDGLIDKVSIINGIANLHTNNGKQLLNPVAMPLWENLLSYSTSYNISEGLNGGYLGNKYSWSAGISMFHSFGNVRNFQADFNGDGLPDAINGSLILINHGNSFGPSGFTPPSINNNLSINHGSGGSLNGSYTLVVPGLGAKVVSNFSLSGNLNTSGATMMVVDINSDGFADIVSAEKNEDDNYEITIYTNQLNQVNLLQTVTNPIGGSFTLEYESSGNRYGSYDPIIKNPTLSHPNNEKMLWDMAQQKQVLKSVTVNDGLDIDQNGLDDGSDSYTTTFLYDGGIYSRREREFLGFTRIETRSPKRMSQLSANTGEHLMFVSNIVNYIKPLSNEFQDRVAYEYNSELAQASYSLIHSAQYVKDTDLGIDERLNFTHLTQATYNTYTYYPIGQTTIANFNKAEMNNPLNPNNLNIGEAASIFPALSKTETFTFLEPGNLNHYAYLNEFEYDEYMNVIVAVDGGLSKATLANWVHVDDYENTDAPPTPIYQIEYAPLYEGPVIAVMDYFPPQDAANLTNMLQQHRIYVETTADPTKLRRKSTVDALNDELLAPITMSQWLTDVSSENSTSDFIYDGFGNVIEVTGPPNHANERLTVGYIYDAVLNQYLTHVSNSYGDENCMDYHWNTGLPKYTLDANRYVNYFEYDNLDRLSKVFGPREYADASTPFTLQFSYYPNGFGNSSTPVAITEHYMGESTNATSQVACAAPAPSARPEYSDVDILHTATFIDGLGRVVQVKKDASKYDPTTQLNNRVHEVSGMVTYDWLGMVIQETQSWISSRLVQNPLEELNVSPPSANPVHLQAIYDYDLLNRVKTLYTATANAAASKTSNSYAISTGYAWDDTYDGQLHFRQDIKDNEHSQNTHAQKFFNSKSAVIATKMLSTNSTNPEIVTHFEYDLLGQMKQTTNPLGLVTMYEYDWFGRVYSEVHPDRGTTSSGFDKAGNVIQIATATGIVNLGYEFNRLITKTYPITGYINNITYTYGSAGDGKNGAGRITGILQGNNIVQEAYNYDELGQVVSESKTIAIPLVGEMKFITKYQYDSWGRMQNMVYPDAEKVVYSYAAAGGELESVTSSPNNGQSTTLDYVSQIGYDGFGNQKYMRYGNQVVTEKTYSPFNRSMNLVQIASPHSGSPTSFDLLNKSIDYRDNGNIWKIENDASSFGASWNDLGGKYTNTYFYDYANRLTSADHVYKGQQNNTGSAVNYELLLTYNEAGGIISKTQQVITGSGANSNMAYTLAYDYQKQSNQKDKHKLKKIVHNGQNEDYTYDPRGNVTQIANHPEHGLQKFIWSEADRLRAVQNQFGFYHYVYDGSGTRILKGIYNKQQINVDGQSINVYSMSPYTVYVNPYVVCTYYADDVDITKHYYAGAQRVASKLYQHPFGLSSEAPNDPQEPNYKAEDPLPYSFFYQDPVENPHVMEEANSIASGLGLTLNNNGNLPAAPGSSLGEIGYVPCDEIDWQNFNPDLQYDGGNLIYIDCLCRYNPEHAQNLGINCEVYSQVYWYHPDYLGNTEFITDAGGYPYQFFYYSAFGETLLQQNANTGNFATPYKFNAKEQDPETGNYYYGARYYNPQTSIWFGVDPLSHLSPNQTPYHFVSNNPVMRIDPDGQNDHEWTINIESGEVNRVGSKGGSETQIIHTIDNSGHSLATVIVDGNVTPEVSQGEKGFYTNISFTPNNSYQLKTLSRNIAISGAYLNSAVGGSAESALNWKPQFAERMTEKVINSNKSADELLKGISKNAKNWGKRLGVAGVGLTVVDGMTDSDGWQNHHTADLILGASFLLIPGVGWIAGGYLLLDIIVTNSNEENKSITELLLD